MKSNHTLKLMFSLLLLTASAGATNLSCFASHSGQVQISFDEMNLKNLKINDQFSFFEKGQRVVAVDSKIDCVTNYTHSAFNELQVQLHCVDRSSPANGKQYFETVTLNADQTVRISEKFKFKTPEEFKKQGYGSRTIMCTRI